MTATARTCANPACGNPLDGHRADAQYCGPPCRTAAWRARTAERLKENTTAAFPTPAVGDAQSRSQLATAVTTTTLATSDSGPVPRVPPSEQALIAAALVAVLFAPRWAARGRGV
jgi:hypothetical protein